MTQMLDLPEKDLRNENIESLNREIEDIENNQIKNFRASLVVQWLRACLPMQGTRVRALVWEDPTCRGAAGPVSPNC